MGEGVVTCKGLPGGNCLLGCEAGGLGLDLADIQTFIELDFSEPFCIFSFSTNLDDLAFISFEIVSFFFSAPLIFLAKSSLSFVKGLLVPLVGESAAFAFTSVIFFGFFI